MNTVLLLLVFLAFGALGFLCARGASRRFANVRPVAARANASPIDRFVTPEVLARQRLQAAVAGGGGMLLLGFLGGWAPWATLPLCVAAAFGAGKLPRYLYARKVEAHRAAFEQQMLNVVLGLTNQLKTGMSITQALQEVAKHSSGAAGEELRTAVSELSMMDLAEVLNHLYRRVPCEDLLLMKSAISLTQKSGGGLSNIMGQLAETIRQRRDFRERLANRVAQGKFEAIMMACAPFAIFLLLLLIDTQLMLLLVTRPLGWVAVGVVLVMETLGYLWIRKIVNIEV
ncbi:MAG: type II secretion system F family protein [Candidatus Spyradenecus sp.]